MVIHGEARVRGVGSGEGRGVQNEVPLKDEADTAFTEQPNCFIEHINAGAVVIAARCFS